MSKIEQLASALHDIYQKEAKRQGDHRHFDKYEDLAESVKEYDRVLARYILEREKQQVEQIERIGKALKFADYLIGKLAGWNGIDLSTLDEEYPEYKTIEQALAAQPQKGK